MAQNPELLIEFLPAMPASVILTLGAVTLSLMGFAIFKQSRGWYWRVLAMALMLLMLLNPALIEEMRETKPDTVLIVMDQSTSNQINKRGQESINIETQLNEKLAQMPNIEKRVLYVNDNADDQGGTMLFSAIQKNAADIPKSHLAAIILITDGQVHDVPVSRDPDNVPIHVLLTGGPDEIDRRLKIVRAPGFGLVGQQQKIIVHIEDSAASEGSASISMRQDGEATQNIVIPVGQDVEIPVTIQHAGANIFELSAAKITGELADENNHAVVTINGVRDRLRVLLISGDPHAGTRVWRNFLKSDPSVDLVHFTILRPPEKQDNVPTEELSLIAFPTKELFEDKLNDFNLIIFDRYRRLSVLPTEYMQNIVQFVERGGALLDAEGPLPDGSLSLFDTVVGGILPAVGNNKVIEGEFVPTLSEDGKRHPVTAGLPGYSKSGHSNWGHWFRQIESEQRRGTVLMTGLNNEPLLVMDRVGQGRVAQLFSDQIWLWARGYNNGGPHSELLRRIAHWLMKEPQLEEDDLTADVAGHTITITQRSLKPASSEITLTKPGNETEIVTLTQESPGLSKSKVNVTKTGLYRISDGRRSIMVGVGGLNPLEYTDLRSSGEKLKPYVQASGGSIRWISQDGMPDLRHLEANRYMSGKSWIGLRKNNNYSINGIKQTPLVPPLAYLLLAALTMLLAWRKEGR